MEEQLIGFETAKLAKEKGFKEKTKFSYSTSTKTYSISYDEFSAPTQTLLQKWLREKHNIFIEISHSYKDLSKYSFHVYRTWDELLSKIMKSVDGELSHYDTYEESLEHVLLTALKLVK